MISALFVSLHVLHFGLLRINSSHFSWIHPVCETRRDLFAVKGKLGVLFLVVLLVLLL